MVKAVMNSVHTGAKGDGKIFVSPIDETYDITTGQKGKV
ncbi:MAG: P-II family nitrogen regulator [Nitrosopumilaceae archaeon]